MRKSFVYALVGVFGMCSVEGMDSAESTLTGADAPVRPVVAGAVSESGASSARTPRVRFDLNGIAPADRYPRATVKLFGKGEVVTEFIREIERVADEFDIQKPRPILRDFITFALRAVRANGGRWGDFSVINMNDRLPEGMDESDSVSIASVSSIASLGRTGRFDGYDIFDTSGNADQED